MLNPGCMEDCLELNFKYVDYQSLAHPSYSSCVCWIAGAQQERNVSVSEYQLVPLSSKQGGSEKMLCDAISSILWDVVKSKLYCNFIDRRINPP